MPAVAFVVKGYPRLSETFIAQEMRSLERAGLDIRIVSLRHPTEAAVHPVHREIRAPVAYLPEYLHQGPARVLAGWRHARRLAGYRAARTAWIRDLRRDPTPNRVRRWGQALVLARELPQAVQRLHAHFIHTPAAVVRYASLLTGLPWTCSAHAKDIWTTPEWELIEKLASAQWVVTCTAAGRDRLAALAAEPQRVRLCYHGIDFGRFPAFAAERCRGEGAPVRLLTVGRAVEKKGIDVLLEALARLPKDLDWRWEHVGDGEILAALKRRAETLGIARRLVWHDAQPQERVLELLRAADLFALASKVARDGDRDGLPNVLMEAQSQGLACVSTTAGAIAELIVHDETGLLVPPENPSALAAALERLIRHADLRRALGRAGERRVRNLFDHRRSVAALQELFDLPAAESAAGPAI